MSDPLEPLRGQSYQVPRPDLDVLRSRARRKANRRRGMVGAAAAAAAVSALFLGAVALQIGPARETEQLAERPTTTRSDATEGQGGTEATSLPSPQEGLAEEPQAVGPPPAPQPGEEGVVRATTPEGEAAVELVLDRESIRHGETLESRLVNRGEVELMTGLEFIVERWNGQSWLSGSMPSNCGWPAVGVTVRVGGSTEPQSWPYPRGDPCNRWWTVEGSDRQEEEAPPGWYRIVKSAGYEDPNGQIRNIKLVARARFQILD